MVCLTPPTYSHIYNLSTVQMSNDKGTWFGWDVTKVGPVTDKHEYDMAKAFAESVGKGEIQAKHGSEESTKNFLLITRILGSGRLSESGNAHFYFV